MDIGKLKLVDETHINLLFDWANDTECRKNSFNSETISFEEHSKWFQYKMQDKNSVMYLYCVLDEPVGQIRLDFEGDKAFIGYSIKSAARGKGYGKQIIKLVEEKIRLEKYQIKYLCGKVKYENEASKKIFEQLDYTPSHEEDYILYCKSI